MKGLFHDFVHRSEPGLILQPRMGFSDPAKMRAGLERVRDLPFPTIGTLTLDSFTRTGQEAEARRALAQGSELNGYPLTVYPAATHHAVLDGVLCSDFPVQVRHGSPLPEAIFAALAEVGIDATEGGPISYCLPYGRIRLERSLEAWSRAVSGLAGLRAKGIEPHLESFGGCMLGQLCPPVLLLAIGLLEAMYFRSLGLRSVSLSFAQGSCFEQDLSAVLALGDLASHFLADMDWHIVVYTFMGLFPKTPSGARRAVEESAKLALLGGARRLIVKTASEASRLPTLEDNLEALSWAAAVQVDQRPPSSEVEQERIFLGEQCTRLVCKITGGLTRLDEALLRAFREGWLDIPYCLHPDNRGLSRSWLDTEGRIVWLNPGNIPISQPLIHPFAAQRADSKAFLELLSFNQRKFDR